MEENKNKYLLMGLRESNKDKYIRINKIQKIMKIVKITEAVQKIIAPKQNYAYHNYIPLRHI